MGFLRRLFRAKKSNENTTNKKRWSFLKSLNDNKLSSSSRLTLPSNATAPASSSSSLTGAELDANKHAIAVAAATAAVAEAALAAAQAAAEVVRLTSTRGRAGSVGGERGSNSSVPPRVGITRACDEVLAAVKIQSAFRGYLARRALRALKALVKLQALVRGHIVRKQMADMLRRMQTLVRLQTRARASRASTSASSHSSSMSAISHHPRCGSNANLGGSSIKNLDGTTISGPNWLDRWMEESLWNDSRREAAPLRNRHDEEKSAKILEVDTWKPHRKPRENCGSVSSFHQIWDSDHVKRTVPAVESPSKYSSRGPNPVPSMSSEEVLSLRSLNFPRGKDETNRSSESSPQVVSLSSRPGSSSARRGPFTPTRSECSWGGYFNGYPGHHPNYMCNTESSRAKVRSQSAPRQRLDFDRFGPSRIALQGPWEGGSYSESNYHVHYDLKGSKTTASNRLTRNQSATSR